MYSENGSPLSLDDKLRITFHLSAFRALLVLRCHGNDIPRLLSLPASIRYMAEPKTTERK
jgi:hypothetical protein